MSFYFKHDEQMADGIRRVVGEQVHHAQAQLRLCGDNRKDAVHELRRCFKRIRATLQLSNFEAEDIFDRESHRYRKLGRLLAVQRDADVLPETFDKLIEAYSKHLEGQTLAREREFIVRCAHAILEKEDFHHLWAKIDRELEQAKQELAAWRFKRTHSVPIPANIPLVVKKTYDRATDNFLTACQDATPEKMHNWRKRVKDLFYQGQLLSATDLKFSPVYCKDLDNLAELLGDHHNLRILHEVVARNDPRAGGSLALEGLLELIAMQQAELENLARDLGGRLFREKPTVFLRQLGKT